MQKSFAVLCLALAIMACAARAQDAPLPSWNEKARTDWWTQNPGPDSWPKAADALQVQLEALYKSNGSRAFSDSDFRGWLEHVEWIRLGLAYPDTISGQHLKTFTALGQDDSVSHLFIENLAPEDDLHAALLNLLKLSEANTADLHEYAALGVAFSVVWDVPFPTDWPHYQVAPGKVPISDLDVVQRFAFYVQSNRDKKLDIDPTTLSVRNLVFLVDSEASLDELRYAQKNRISWSQFADVYSSINYDMARLSNSGGEQYVWPFDSYKLADIEKKGGICIDQSYYAQTIGKGRGIPTIGFTGYGMDGAHAWFGYLSNSGKWELDCGRYETQDFPKGFAVDPQTWVRIDDATLQNFFKTGGKDPNYPAEMTALTWAMMHKDDATAYAHILDDAHDIMPEWSPTWRMRAELVEKAGDLDKTKQFYTDWTRQFSNYPEMKVEGQKRLYLVLKHANDPDAEGLIKDIIIQNRSEGFDLGIEAGSQAMIDKLKAQNWDEARAIFERTVRDFGEKGGLTLFREVIYPYINILLEADKVDQADKGLRFTSDRMQVDPSSQVGQAFEELKGKVASKKKGN